MKKSWIMAAGAIVVIVAVGIVAVKVKKSLPASGADSAVASSLPVQKLLEEATQDQTQGELVKAKAVYQQIVAEHPDYEKVEEIQNKLSDLNMKIIFSKEQTPQTLIYQVEPGDSLGKLAKQYHTTKEFIQRSNGLKSDVIRVGEKLRIWDAPFSVVINKSQNILILKSGQELIKVYRVATGKDNSTPTGRFTITVKIANPVWFKPGSAPIPPESPENELGSRWMGFQEDPHYGIHGTIHPNAIGGFDTAGCVRLTNPDVEELFDLLPVGTPVVIQN